MMALPEVVLPPSQEPGSQFQEVHPWRFVQSHADSEPGLQKTANDFTAKCYVLSLWTLWLLRCDCHRSQDLKEEHLCT